MAFSTQALVIGLSLFLHVAVVGLGLMQWSHSRPLHVRLDQPVAYQVDLVRLDPPAPGPARSATTAPAPQAAPEAQSKPKPAPAPAKPVPPAPKPKAAVEIPEQPKPEAKPAKPAPKPEPEPEPEPEPQPAKPKPPKAAPKQPTKPAPPARKPEPTREQILAEALGAAQQDVSRRAPDEREQALASLRQGAVAQESGGGASEGRAAGGLVAVYAQMVEAQIKAHWRYPQAGARQNLVAMVEIQLDRKGRVLGTRVVRSSGRPDFDASAERAVEETRQLPAPPRDDLRRIQITFNLQEL